MRIVFVLFFVLLLAACGGANFVRPESDSLILGTTTYDQTVAKFGHPRRTETATRNGIPLKSITYSYAVAVPFTTKLSTKALVLIFQDNTLVSYDYVSSFDDEKELAKYDEKKMQEIANGDKRSKVIILLGKPGGEAIYPAVSAKGHSLVRYTFLDTYRVAFLPAPRITRRSLTISYDPSDNVSDIQSTESKPE